MDNVTFEPDNANKSSRQDEGEGPEEEALVELERLLEQEGLKLQSGVEELKIINLNKKEEAKEIWVGKKMPLDLRQRLAELLREYVDVFTWSYRDMPEALDSQCSPSLAATKKDEARSGVQNQIGSGKTMECRLLGCSRITSMSQANGNFSLMERRTY
ncbi:hypothetical protein CR513_46629, partial [Mucuna pruriens]